MRSLSDMGIIDSLVKTAIQHLTARDTPPPAFEWPTPLNGPGYSIEVPAGFTLLQGNPMGGYALLPPGSTPPPKSPAIVMVDPIPAQYVPMLMQNM